MATAPGPPDSNPGDPPRDEVERRRGESEPLYTTAEVLTHFKRLEEAEKFGREPNPPYPID